MSPFFAVIVLYGLGLTASMQVGLIGPIAPDLRAAFGLSQAQFGLVASLITAAGALCAIPAGVWAARAGLRRSLILGGGMMILGAVIFATAQYAIMLYAGRLITSVGYLLIVVGAPSWMTAFDSRKLVAMAMATWGTFIPVGIALGNWVSAAVAVWLDWRMAVAASTLPVVVLLPLLALLNRPKSTQSRKSLLVGVVGVMKSRDALGVAASFAFFAGATSAALAFMPVMLSDNLDIGIAPAAGIIGVTAICGNIAGSVAAGIALGRQIPGQTLLTIFLPVMACAIATVFISTQTGISITALIIFNISQGLVAGTCFALLPAIAKDGLSMPALQGMLAQFAEIFVVIVPPVTGAMIDFGGWTGAASLLGLCYFAASGISVALRKT
ncbi:MFS transporter [Thalassospira sp. MA62]|nr:MFS transporter [Thalassospira sp. MA62]